METNSLKRIESEGPETIPSKREGKIPAQKISKLLKNLLEI